MNHFFDVDDIGSVELALARAQSIKADPRKGYTEGYRTSIGLLFTISAAVSSLPGLYYSIKKTRT